MSKRELIERIIHINRSATLQFLQEFSENELSDYLRQLETIDRPVRHSRQRNKQPR